MGEVKGFLKYNRVESKKLPVESRITNFNEFTELPSQDLISQQGARCMDCGTPFCHNGCPIGNFIPD